VSITVWSRASAHQPLVVRTVEPAGMICRKRREQTRHFFPLPALRRNKKGDYQEPRLEKPPIGVGGAQKEQQKESRHRCDVDGKSLQARASVPASRQSQEKKRQCCYHDQDAGKPDLQSQHRLTAHSVPRRHYYRIGVLEELTVKGWFDQVERDETERGGGHSSGRGERKQ